MKLNIYFVAITLGLFWCSTISVKGSQNDSAAGKWCGVDKTVHIHECRDILGEKKRSKDLGIIPGDTLCNISIAGQLLSVSCVDGVLSVPNDIQTVEVKRSAAGVAAGITAAGSAVSGISSLAGTIFSIVCVFERCGQQDPNTPPVITELPFLSNGAIIYCEEGKATANVSWILPKIIDKEDGNLPVSTSPPSGNGAEYPEGKYTVYFTGTDSGGLSVSTSITFEVKVHRCALNRWPDHGTIDCETSDITFGSTCSVRCHLGYILPVSDSSSIKCGKWGIWTPPSPPNCKPKTCNNVSIYNGYLRCPNNKMVFDNICEVICEDGYKVKGNPLMACDETGQWGQHPVCSDITPPRFLPGECPHDIQVYVDSADNSAKVDWDEPKGKDNSNDNVSITEVNGYAPGRRMEAGMYTIKYSIEDSQHNFGEMCVFSVQVMSLSCAPPILNVVGGDHLKYDCPDEHHIGAQCTLACKSGYPMGGVNQIQCLPEDKSYPPKPVWKWDEDGLAPFCKETNCSRAALREPRNGALACSEWTHGQMCQMQCQVGFDIPNIGDGMFVCGKSDGTWRPTNNVPSCNRAVGVDYINLPSQFFYYTGRCNSSVENLKQIQENFVQALNASVFHEECRDVPECQAKFVDVTCGPVSRRKRDAEDVIVRRSLTSMAYKLRVEFLIPFKKVPGKTTDDIFYENEVILNRMSQAVQKEVNVGRFNLNINGLLVTSVSYEQGSARLLCPNGTLAKWDTGTCVGCPEGNYLERGRCKECPLGTYQDIAYSPSCKQCPPFTNTTVLGATNVSQCLDYCAKGGYSSNGLVPCTKCLSGWYQPNAGATGCLRCDSNQMTSGQGATSKSQCQAYDVQIGSSQALITTAHIFDSITIFMWVRPSLTNLDTAMSRHPSVGKGFTILVQPSLSVGINGVIPIITGTNIAEGKWTAIAMTMDKASQEVEVFVKGQPVYRNASFSFSTQHILNVNDTIELQGDMKISAFYVLPRIALSSEIFRWSQNCTADISGASMSIDNLAQAENVATIIPAVCDAFDECESSPCGKFDCVNKVDGYQCICVGGYSGRHCEIPPDFCVENNCQNRASCVNGKSNYTCACPFGFSGILCQIKAVDGHWSDWTRWTMCSKSCGGGVASRSRRCDNPPPDPEGTNCTGSSSESIICATQSCPECYKLSETRGMHISCNESSEMKTCKVSCTPGLVFTTAILPYYECGAATGYKWNHQTITNPTARLPSCSVLKPPAELGVSFEGVYESMPCHSIHFQSIKDKLQLNLRLIDCKVAGSCETNVSDPLCKYVVINNALHSTMNVKVAIQAKPFGNTYNGSLHVEAGVNNETALPHLQNLINQTHQLDTSAKKILNNSAVFFLVEVGGVNYTISSSKLIYNPVVKCPQGSVRLDIFCAECPEGAYLDGDRAVLCPQGQYQDETGQSSCKQCPSGTITTGTGSVSLSECSGKER